MIVFESDQDLDPRTAYLCYDDRWLLELVFNRYKGDECLDKTNVQGDFSVIGGEFVNFISTVATCRIIRKATKAGLLNSMSYGELMDDLSSVWRRVDAPSNPRTDDNGWVHTLNTASPFFQIQTHCYPYLFFMIRRKRSYACHDISALNTYCNWLPY